MLAGVFKPRSGRQVTPFALKAAPAGARSDEAIDLAEPRLEEVLADPAVRLLMRSDGVPIAALRALIDETRARLGARMQ